MIPGMVPWYDLSKAWYFFEKVQLFINRTITKGSFGGFEREITKFEGEFELPSSFVLEFFFYDQQTPCHAPCSNLELFWANLLYLGSYVHFLGINAHNSISHNRSMEKFTKMFSKIMIVGFTKSACLLQGMVRDFKDMCPKSQPQTYRLLVFQL
jgi:hypothetical protein